MEESEALTGAGHDGAARVEEVHLDGGLRRRDPAGVRRGRPRRVPRDDRGAAAARGAVGVFWALLKVALVLVKLSS